MFNTGKPGKAVELKEVTVDKDLTVLKEGKCIDVY